MPKRFDGGQSYDERIFLRDDIYIEILFKEWLDYFMKSSRNIHGYAFAFICSLALQIAFLRNSPLNSNHLAQPPFKNYVFVFSFIKVNCPKDTLDT